MPTALLPPAPPRRPPPSAPPLPSFRHSSPLLGERQHLSRARRVDPASPPECGEGSSGPGRPVPSIPAESLPQPAPDSIRGTRSGAGTQQQPLRPAPRCHPDLPTSQPLDPSQQPAPSPHAIPRPRPPLHPHHPSAQPASPPKKSAKSRHPPTGNTPKVFPVGGCEYPHKRAVTPPHSPQTHRTDPHPRRLQNPPKKHPAARGRQSGDLYPAQSDRRRTSRHPRRAGSTPPRPGRLFLPRLAREPPSAQPSAKPSTRSCSFSWGRGLG